MNGQMEMNGEPHEHEMQQTHTGTMKGDNTCSGGRRKVKVRKRGRVKTRYITSVMG